MHPRLLISPRVSAGERGFTLNELLVAMTVTIIGLAGLMSLHVTTVRGNATASQASEAVLAAEEALESLRRDRVPGIEATFAAINTTEWSPGFAMTAVTGRTGVIYQPVVHAEELLSSAGGALTGLVRFRVVIYWMDGGAALPALNLLPADSDHSLEVHMVRTRVEVL